MAILATITCSKCHYQSVVTLSLSGSMGMNVATDLKPTEISKFLAIDPLGTDDLLDAYQYLKKTKGLVQPASPASASDAPMTLRKPRRLTASTHSAAPD